MKFVILNDYSNSKDRLRVKSDEPIPIIPEFKEVKTVGVLIEVVKDFDPYSDEIQIVSGTDSFQIRPKAIYINKKNDYYWMSEGKRIYLSESEVGELDRFLDKIRAMEEQK